MSTLIGSLSVHSFMQGQQNTTQNRCCHWRAVRQRHSSHNIVPGDHWDSGPGRRSWSRPWRRNRSRRRCRPRRGCGGRRRCKGGCRCSCGRGRSCGRKRSRGCRCERGGRSWSECGRRGRCRRWSWSRSWADYQHVVGIAGNAISKDGHQSWPRRKIIDWRRSKGGIGPTCCWIHQEKSDLAVVDVAQLDYGIIGR